MPYFHVDFMTSDVGRALFVVWALVLVVCHMQYVHSPVDISRRFTTFELVADLVGLTWMRNLCAADFPEATGLQVFLFVHFVVHALSLLWSLFAWPSLDQHMREFRRRALPKAFWMPEWIYEQSDTALYLTLALRLLSRAPPVFVMAVVVGFSMLCGTRRFRAWFAPPRAPADDAAAPATSR